MTAVSEVPVGFVPKTDDPRHPVNRLGALFDDGDFELISPLDDSGMLAGVGLILLSVLLTGLYVHQTNKVLDPLNDRLKQEAQA